LIKLTEIRAIAPYVVHPDDPNNLDRAAVVPCGQSVIRL